MKKLVLKAIRFYQLHISPLKGVGCCIYTPTCSEYTRLAVEKYGVIKGLAKGFWRILKTSQGEQRPDGNTNKVCHSRWSV